MVNNTSQLNISISALTLSIFTGSYKHSPQSPEMPEYSLKELQPQRNAVRQGSVLANPIRAITHIPGKLVEYQWKYYCLTCNRCDKR